MTIAIITGSGGLIGAESVRFFSKKFDRIIGIDNDSRKYFFGKLASVKTNISLLKKEIKNYNHKHIDIRNNKIEKIFRNYKKNIKFILHCAAQPSHDWAAKEPLTDFSINALGTLNILENIRKYCPDAKLAHISTNKVYGDRPNLLPLKEQKKRYEISKNHKYFQKGIDETMSIDDSKHSLFGASKLAADIYCQEYWKYFNLKVGIFRGCCLTGPLHQGVELHGFLNYLIKVAKERKKYYIFGYKGKQVRDNIHSEDVVKALWEFYKTKNNSGVYNIGGGRTNSCSILEVINILKKKYDINLNYKLLKENRSGDHIWYISNNSKFQTRHKNWKIKRKLGSIISEIVEN
jgi:CDP-paratose 2-epimerase|tara:strand:- start:3956 stop:4999 length:1044 start_codon:yes stop_codon:yes gene_type:complete